MWILFIADLKMMFRNRQAIFWSFMFPLMFTFIFGFFFGKNTSIGTVDLINKSQTELSQNLTTFLDESKVFKINKTDNFDNSKDQLKNGKISAIVVVPETFGELTPTSAKQIEVIYDPGNNQVNSALTGLVNGFLTQANYKVQNAEPIFSIKEEPINDRVLSYFDFVLAGILGLALMNSSIIGIAVSMSKYREDKILKRVTTTPIKSWQFIVPEVLSRLVLNFMQITLILIIGKYVFDAHIYGSIPIIFLVSLFGALLFQLMGFVIASLTKTTDAAQGMATAITIPMMFLAGVFFPIDSLPKWIYSIVQFLPLAPLLKILRMVALEARSPFDNPINIAIVAGWIVVSLVFSIFRFRLSDE